MPFLGMVPGTPGAGQGHSSELGCQVGRVGGKGRDQGMGREGTNERAQRVYTRQPSPKLVPVVVNRARGRPGLCGGQPA